MTAERKATRPASDADRVGVQIARILLDAELEALRRERAEQRQGKQAA